MQTEWGFLGEGTSKHRLSMVRAALLNDYPISPEIRRMIVTQAAIIAGTAKNRRTKLAAMKVLIAADKCNIQREGNQIIEKHHETLEATAILRAAMQGADVRDQLAALSDRVCEQFPLAVQAEVAAIQDDAAKETLEGLSQIAPPTSAPVLGEHKNGDGNS